MKKLTREQKRILSEAALLLCGMAWGGSFVVTKNVTEILAPSWTLGLRFIVPVLLLAAFLRKRLWRAGGNVWKIGAISGVLQFAGFIMQMIGLTTTTAGNSAFISALYVVFVPFCLWAHSKKRPRWTVFAAGGVCVVGVGLLVLQQGVSVNVGDIWTLACAALFAVNIALISISLVGGADALVFTCIQFLFTAIPSFIMGAFMDALPPPELFLRADVLWGLFFLIFICTIFAQIAQNVALGYADPSHASLLMGTEAVFGALCGALFLGEAITPRFIAGAALVAAAIVLSEKTKDRAKKPRRVK